MRTRAENEITGSSNCEANDGNGARGHPVCEARRISYLGLREESKSCALKRRDTNIYCIHTYIYDYPCVPIFIPCSNKPLQATVF